MNALSGPDLTLLAKLLALLSSPYAGERDAAGLAAHRFIEQRGLSWEELLTTAATVEKKLTELEPWRKTVSACLKKPGSLRTWEKGFLVDLPRMRHLSVKQQFILKQIARRILFGYSA